MLAQRESKATISIEELATALGGRVIVPFPGNENMRYIEMPEGYWLWISETDRWTSKASISLEQYHNPLFNGIASDQFNRDSLTTRISFNCERGAQAIVKDIQRRLLPHCVTLTANVRDIRAKREERANKIEVTAAKLEAAWPGILGGDHWPRNRGAAEFHCMTSKIRKGYIWDDGEVDIEFQHVPADILVEMLKLGHKLMNIAVPGDSDA